jgi:hypothetical protein
MKSRVLFKLKFLDERKRGKVALRGDDLGVAEIEKRATEGIIGRFEGAKG